MTQTEKQLQTFYDGAAGFVASFKTVVERGFFTKFEVKIQADYDNMGFMVDLKAAAYVPDLKKEDQKGVSPLIDPTRILEIIRESTDRTKLKVLYANCDTKVENWPPLDEDDLTDGFKQKGLSLHFELHVRLVDEW